MKKGLGPGFTGESATSDQLKQKTDAAVSEGQADAAGYVGQAKGLANSAIETVQVSFHLVDIMESLS